MNSGVFFARSLFEVAGNVSGAPPALCKKWKPRSGVENENLPYYLSGNLW